MLDIYFVHDQQESPSIRRCHLERAGYRVTMFESGAELLTALSEHEPDLVLLDVLLPGVHGFDVCRLLRHKYAPERLPVVITSDLYRTQPYFDESKDAGAQAYLVRPMDPPAFVDAIAQVFAARIAAPASSRR